MSSQLSCFRVGDYVDVDSECRTGRVDSEGGKGYIESLSPTIDVRYVISGLLSPAVDRNRIHTAKIATTGRRKSFDGSRTPSILDYSYPEYRRQQRLIAVSSTSTSTRTNHVFNFDNCRFDFGNPADTRILLNLSLKKTDVVDIIDKLNKTNMKGWLRKNENLNNKISTTKNTHLNLEERNMVLKLLLCLKHINCQRAVNKVSYAWGVTRYTVQRLFKTETLEGGNLQRKTRRDKGLTVFNSEHRRQSTFTTFSVFKKIKRMENRGERFTKDQLYSSWMSLSDENMNRIEELTEQQKERCALLLVEIGQILRRTQGRLTWQQLASSLCGTGVPVVSHMSIARAIMSLPDSTYTTTRIFPLLNEATKRKRLEWSMNFWKFWTTVKVLTNVKVLLVHMDEKWFYSVAVRNKNKFVPFLGMQNKVSSTVQHKSHIHKEMLICTTAYLPHNNDMERGGMAYKVSMERVGKLLPAKRDSYKRVYNDDNTFSYPHIEQNIIRRKGELYFQSMEINATKEGSVSAPKFSLLKFFVEKEIPRLEKLTETLKESYNQPVIVRYQMDSAGPHTDVKLLDRLQEEFHVRGWILVRQPAQSPLTNVKDTCIFPSLSKTVSWNQSNLYNNKVLDGEELNTYVQVAFENLPLDTVARSYLGHHQMVNAIVEDNGDDNHMRSTSGSHCGVRRQSVVICDNENLSNNR